MYIIGELCPKPMTPMEVAELALARNNAKTFVFGTGWSGTVIGHALGALKYALAFANGDGKVRFEGRGWRSLSPLSRCLSLSDSVSLTLFVSFLRAHNHTHPYTM